MSRARIDVDLLHEVRRVLRILRRVERSLVQGQNRAKRNAANAAERAELKAIAEAARQLPARNELERESGRRAVELEP